MLKRGLMWLDRRNDRCMHYHDLDNQWIESLLERHIYSRGLGRGINMRLSYPHKDITLEGCRLRHRWCGLGFGHNDHVYLFQGISHPNIQRYGTSVVGWLCLDHSLGVEWVLLSNLFSFFLYYFGLLISNRLLIVVLQDTPINQTPDLNTRKDDPKEDTDIKHNNNKNNQPNNDKPPSFSPLSLTINHPPSILIQTIDQSPNSSPPID